MNLLHASLSKSARSLYYRSLQLYLNFHRSVNTLPLSAVDVCNFIGHLFQKSYSPSTIYSHVSAISYLHQILNLNDPTSTFIVKNLLKCCANLRKKNDILSQIVVGMDKCILNFFNRVCVFISISCFVRLGEILTHIPTDSQKVLQVQDTCLAFSGTPVNLTITLRSFKNMKLNQPVTICIDTNLRDPNMCPVAAFMNYRNHFIYNRATFSIYEWN